MTVIDFRHTAPTRAASSLWQAHGYLPVPIRPTQRLTGANGGGFLCSPGDGVLFVNGIIIPTLGERAFLLSDLRPPGRPEWVRAAARKSPDSRRRQGRQSRTGALLAPPCRKVDSHPLLTYSETNRILQD